eukprot:TRINITY_DN23077_c0_g1_i1.p1 TRINITY_DN23077_c0_g1~~TRINITY_DN23077_c0_g1_i1.p1  ORF type:complete len:136 (+),score=20.02 TRINITY_DN23077_c0_g1_i1:399-806(+)
MQYDSRQSPSGDSTPSALNSTVPYVFVVPVLTECPQWFQDNLRNTVGVQETGPGSNQPVLLIEGEPGACREICVELGVWHVTADHNQTLQYLSLIHISEPTRLLSISYAVFCLKKKKITTIQHQITVVSSYNHTS